MFKPTQGGREAAFIFAVIETDNKESSRTLDGAEEKRN